MRMSIIEFCPIIAGLSVIPALVVSVRKYMHCPSAFSKGLMVVCGLFASTEWMMLLFFPFSKLQPVNDYVQNNNIDFTTLIKSATCGVILFLNVILLLLALYLRRCSISRFLLILLGMFLATLFVLAVIVSIHTGMGLVESFFGTCCGVVYATGVAFGFTYKEICVIVNIYMESALCLLSALWVTWVAIERFCHRKTTGNGWLMTAGIIYGLVYLVGFLLICRHYAMPLSDAFNLCYHELVQLAEDYNTTYINMNFVVFILFFLVVTIGNLLIAKKVKRVGPCGKK